MSVHASQSRLRFDDSGIDVARIVSISATISIHILAFMFLMAPIAMLESAKPAETRTEIVFIPVKPKVIPPVVVPVQLKPISKPIIQTLAPAISKPVQMPVPDATTSEPILGDTYVAEQVVDSGMNSIEMGGDVDASTREQYPMRYPIAALRIGATGVAVVLARYDASGTITQTSIYQSSRNKDLDRAALLGVKKWKINPRMVQGQATGGEALVNVEFQL